MEREAEKEDISIHAPRTGSDSIKSISAFISLHFNPRSPHGERQRCVFGMASGGYFNPRSPHGERPANAAALPSCICISIHAPRTGSDDIVEWGGADELISIHAPRTGSDVCG